MKTNEGHNKELLVQSLEGFYLHAKDICVLWEQLDDETQNNLAKEYPFDKSFDEVTHDILDWLHAQKEINKL